MIILGWVPQCLRVGEHLGTELVAAQRSQATHGHQLSRVPAESGVTGCF